MTSPNQPKLPPPSPTITRSKRTNAGDEKKKGAAVRVISAAVGVVDSDNSVTVEGRRTSPRNRTRKSP